MFYLRINSSSSYYFGKNKIMKRHKSLHPLSHDHHQGLILAQQLKKDAPRYKGMPSTLDEKKKYTIAFYKSELKKHFSDEEKILFPAAVNKSQGLDRLIQEIISEHKIIELLIRDLEKSADLELVLDELGKLLENHIRKEERELFVEIEKILSDEELNLIGRKLNS
jgi:hemerythrin-like domain-containing protein